MAFLSELAVCIGVVLTGVSVLELGLGMFTSDQGSYHTLYIYQVRRYANNKGGSSNYP